MKILGVNISHHMSFSVIKDGKVLEYYEEDRFNRIKNFDPFNDGKYNTEYKALLQFKNVEFDLMVVATFGRYPIEYDYKILENVSKQVNFKNLNFDFYQHHLYHAITGYYFSKYDEAIAIIRDGGGSSNINYPGFQEMDSVYFINKNKVQNIYKHYSNAQMTPFQNKEKYMLYPPKEIQIGNCLFSSRKVGGKKHLEYSYYCNLDGRPGELMGLAPYGMIDKKYKNINYKYAKLGARVQKQTFDETCKLIDKYNHKNIILSGGYFMNCLNNFKLVKKYPQFNFFVDPIPHDGGTSIGSALYFNNYANNKK